MSFIPPRLLAPPLLITHRVASPLFAARLNAFFAGDRKDVYMPIGPDAIIPTGSGDTIDLTLCHSRQLLRIAFTGSHAFLVSPQTARVLGAWLQHLADELDPPNEPVLLPFPTLEQDEG
jgi:hypothetical protein